jgi:hypothetical protein
MGGSSGGIIVQNAAKATLSNPIVHGSLPEKWLPIIDSIMKKDLPSWTAKDKKDMAACFTWALTNLT